MAEQAQDTRLGNEVKLLKSGNLTGALGGLGLAVILIGAALAIGIIWNTAEIPAALCVAGLLIFAASLFGLPSAIRNRKTQMAVHEHGFAFNDGKTQFSIRWDEITAVWKKYTRTSRGRTNLSLVTVEGRGGARLAFSPDTLNQGLAVTEYIQQRALEFQLPAYLKAYQQGQTLAFGPVEMSESGLAIGGKRLMWDQVKSITNYGWALAINESGLSAWGSADGSAVPNPTLLLHVIQRVGGKGVKLKLPETVTLK